LVIRGFRGRYPQIDPSVFVADNATLVGDVYVGARSSVWFGAVIRGDVFHIRIGSETSIQDNTVIHVTHDRFATVVGNQVTVGHAVTLHGCTIGDQCIIGMGSTILDQEEVGERCIVRKLPRKLATWPRPNHDCSPAPYRFRCRVW
jgi:gamma-carbonic anhydrase